MESLVKISGKIGLLVSFLLFFSMTIRMLIVKIYNGIPIIDDNFSTVNEILHYFTISVTLIILAVPEGLPLAVLMSIAYSTD